MCDAGFHVKYGKLSQRFVGANNNEPWTKLRRHTYFFSSFPHSCDMHCQLTWLRYTNYNYHLIDYDRILFVYCTDWIEADKFVATFNFECQRHFFTSKKASEARISSFSIQQVNGLIDGAYFRRYKYMPNDLAHIQTLRTVRIVCWYRVTFSTASPWLKCE